MTAPSKPAPSTQSRRASWRRSAAMAAAALLLITVAVPLTAPPLLRFAADWAMMWERTARLVRYHAGLAPIGGPDVARLDERLAEAGLRLGDRVLVRIFKEESALELWMLGRQGRYQLFATYPICRWSGALGPKLREGDKQSPEGFYTVSRRQLNPASRWHRSFNLGFPNAFDRSLGRTGSFLMVHGGCSSVGCYAVTNGLVDEIWRLVTAALRGGQKRFQVHAFPFRMTASRMALRRGHRWSGFWETLQPGYEAFETHNQALRMQACGGQYRLEGIAEPTRQTPRVVAGCGPREIDALPQSGRAVRPASASRNVEASAG